MTPEQAIKHIILSKTAAWEDKELDPGMDGDDIDAAYDDLVEKDSHYDAKYETREGQVETIIPCECSRHYESKSVAAQAPSGQWVGWTYWYGGGKHGEPEAIDWMDEAYFLDCTEEEKVVTVRTFTKVEAAQ